MSGFNSSWEHIFSTLVANLTDCKGRALTASRKENKLSKGHHAWQYLYTFLEVTCIQFFSELELKLSPSLCSGLCWTHLRSSVLYVNQDGLGQSKSEDMTGSCVSQPWSTPSFSVARLYAIDSRWHAHLHCLNTVLRLLFPGPNLGVVVWGPAGSKKPLSLSGFFCSSSWGLICWLCWAQKDPCVLAFLYSCLQPLLSYQQPSV